MRRGIVILCSLFFAFATVRLFMACLEITPIVVERDGFTPDAGCIRCLEQPEGCRDIIQRCLDDPRCTPVYACVDREACFDLRTIDDKIKCGLPCAQEAGITAVADPVISDYLVGLVACAQDKCAVPCNLVDATVSF